jgi:uridylate kinase
MLKVSGEALMGSLDYGTDPERVEAIAGQIAEIQRRGVEVAVVCGAGNIYRGLQGAARAWTARPPTTWACSRPSSTRCRSRTRWRSRTCHTRVQSAIQIQEVAEPYIRRRAMRHLEKGRVVIFAAGTGNPFFTTDTAAALRAVEVHAEAMLMAKNGVEGVYTGDPKTDPDATFLAEITHMDALQRGLRVMDSTALTLCMENRLPIHVFNMDDERNIERIVSGERVGTLVATPIQDA